MRPFLLAIFTIAALIGIPRLANSLREGPAPDKGTVSVQAAAPQHIHPALDAVSGAQPPSPALQQKKPPPVQLLPISLQPSQLTPGTAASVPSVPANERQLISAIQTELRRLGLYRGPDNGRWSKSSRYAARLFLRRSGDHVRIPQPTIELLRLLQAANPAKERVPVRLQSPRRDLQPLQSARLSLKDSPPKVAAAMPAPAAPDEDYLPPWMRGSARTANNGMPANGAVPSEIAGEGFGSGSYPRQIHHRKHRVSRGDYPGYRGYSPRRAGRRFFSPF